MDPQVGSMISNVSAFWTLSYIFSIHVLLFNRKRIFRHDFWWFTNGILAVTYSMEVGACVCFLWAHHNCQGFILIKDWMNWVISFFISLFIAFLGMIILKILPKYFGFVLMIVLFAVKFTTIENIIFLLPLLRMYITRTQDIFITG